MQSPAWSLQRCAQLPHPMACGGRLVALSDGSLMLLTRDGPDRFGAVFHIQPGEGRSLRMSSPVPEPFCAVPLQGDRLLMATPGADHALLWSPLTQQAERVRTPIPSAPWVCDDVFEGEVYLLANRDLSGSAAGFDFVDNDTFMAIFDPSCDRFTQPFQRVQGRDLRGLVVQSKDELLAYGFGRFEAYCSLLLMSLDEPEETADRALPLHEWTRFIGSDSERGMILWGQRGRTQGVMRARRGQATAEVVWSHRSHRRSRLSFRAATLLRDGSTLIFCQDPGAALLLLSCSALGEVTPAGHIQAASVCCAAQAADGHIYVAGAGKVLRISPPRQRRS